MINQFNSPVSQSMVSPLIDPIAPPRSRLKTWLQRWSLRQKVTAIAILLGALPVLGIGAMSYYFANRSLTQQATEDQQSLAIHLSDLVSRYMAQRYADIQVLANLPLLSNVSERNTTNVSEKEAALDRIAQAYRVYSELAMFDLEGNPILQTGQRPRINQAAQAYFRDAVKANRATIAQPVLAADGSSFEVYLTAPIKEPQSDKTIGIVRATLPFDKLAEQFQSYTTTGREYSVIDTANQIVLTSQSSRFNQNAAAAFAEFPAMQAERQTNSRSFSDAQTPGQLFFSYAPWTKLENLPELNWQIMLGNHVDRVFATRKPLLLILGLGTAIAALAAGLIAAWFAQRLTHRIVAVSKAVQRLGQGQLETRLRLTGNDEIASLGSNINYMAAQLQKLLHEQIQNSENLQRLNEATFNIRKSLDSNLIMQTAVNEARKLLNVDRAVVYLFDQNWQGRIVAESVSLEFPASLGVNIHDPCFAEKFIDKYKAGRIHKIPNLAEADLDACYREQLEMFEVKANLVAPMVVDGNLIGLLVAHHCAAPHDWEAAEITLFTQVAVHLGSALEQVSLAKQREKVTQAELLAEQRREQKDTLEGQLLELLYQVESVAKGDLTIRANVTSGEIGTVADFFNSIVENLQHIVSQVKQAALQVNSSLSKHEHAVRSMAEESLQQAEETTATLDSVQQMLASIEAVAQSAQQAAAVSRSASVTAKNGGQAMDQTVEQILELRSTIGDTAKKVKRLGESSQQISKVVSLINQITVQTNLLAINAGIEAARTGDGNQGFSVIAEEVAALAARAADATREIEQLIVGIQLETAEVVEAMEQGTTQVVESTRFVENAKQSLAEIVWVSQQIDQLVQSISTTTVSQVETSHSIRYLMEKIARISQQASESSAEVSNSLHQTVDIAQNLRQSVETFKVS